MKFYVLLALLPCVLAADIPTISCPDGNICNVGQTCCEKSGHFECCDIPEAERENKKLVPASSYAAMRNMSMTMLPGAKQMQAYGDCPTRCSADYCCPFRSAACCTGVSCCPAGHRCCGNFPSEWCCRRNQRCAGTYMYCVGGAAGLSPALFSVFAILLIAMSLKHF